MAETILWESHKFHILRHNGAWLALPGIYIFCGFASDGWVAYYIGQTDDFKVRIPSHEVWPEAVRLGATHVHARVVQEQANRDSIEAELIRAFQPPLNTQLRQ